MPRHGRLHVRLEQIPTNLAVFQVTSGNQVRQRAALDFTHLLHAGSVFAVFSACLSASTLFCVMSTSFRLVEVPGRLAGLVSFH
jgi:hypothetical protein